MGHRVKYYVIENDDNPRLRWSNSDGWVTWKTLEDFTPFSESERAMCDLPIGGHWILVSQYIPDETGA